MKYDPQNLAQKEDDVIIFENHLFWESKFILGQSNCGRQPCHPCHGTLTIQVLSMLAKVIHTTFNGILSQSEKKSYHLILITTWFDMDNCMWNQYEVFHVHKLAFLLLFHFNFSIEMGYHWKMDEILLVTNLRHWLAQPHTYWALFPPSQSRPCATTQQFPS